MECTSAYMAMVVGATALVYVGVLSYWELFKGPVGKRLNLHRM